MPGVYRKKICPVCSKEHRKRGIHCGQSCANVQREYTDETREKMSNSLKQYALTPEGITTAIMNNRRVHAIRWGKQMPVVAEDYLIDIPTIHDIPDGYANGELWQKNNDLDDNF